MRVLQSIEEARALATFPVLEPANIPDGYKLTQVRYFKLDARCSPDIDPRDCARAHNDFVELRYTSSSGETLAMTQGFGGPPAGGTTHWRWAPPGASGTLTVAGRETYWVAGHARAGASFSGGPFAEADWVDDGARSLTWFVTYDTNPGGSVSPRCISIGSSSLSLDTLVRVAASLPSTVGLRPQGDDC
jgi:hypothetical protein